MALLLGLVGAGLWGDAQHKGEYGIGMSLEAYYPGGGGEGTLQADGTRRYAAQALAEIDHPSSDAARAGLRSGDVLLALGDVALGDSTTRATRDAAEAARRGPLGSAVRVVVRRDGEAVPFTVVRGGRVRALAASLGLSQPALASVSDWLELLGVLSACAVGLFLFVRARALGYRAELGLALAGFGALVAVFDGRAGLPKWGFLAILFLGVPVALPLLVRTVVRFPDGRVQAPWIRRVHWLPLAVMALVMGLAVGLQSLGEAGRVWLDALLVPLLKAGIVGSALGASAAALTARYLRTDDAEVRQQMKWVLVPLVLVVLTFAWTQGVEREVGALHAEASLGAFVLSRAVGWLQELGFAMLPLAVLAGVLRFRPWDADLWIGRSAAVGAATLGLAAIFAGGSEALRVGLRASMGEGADAVAAALAGVISVIVFNPTREWVQARAERGLRRTRDILGERLPLVLGGRQVVAPASEIARVAIGGVREALATDRAAVLLLQPGGWRVAGAEGVTPEAAAAWAEAAAAEPDGALPAAACQAWGDPTFVLRVPLRSAEGAPVGLLALGTHGEGRGYSTEERRALDRVARPLAEALLVAERREAAREAEYARLARLVERVGGDGRAGSAEPAVGT